MDEKGYAWVGTNLGLSFFDGISVETFTHIYEDSTSIADNNIHDILPELNKGRVWVATARGLSVLDIKTKKFFNYKHDPANPNSIPDHQAERVFKDKAGEIWIGFRENGLLRYRPESDDFEHYLCQDTSDSEFLCPPILNDIQEDLTNDSILWLGANGIIRFNKISGDFDQYIFDSEDERKRLYVNSPRNLLIHPNGKIYFGTWWYGTYVFDIHTKKISPLEPCYLHNTEPFRLNVINGFYSKNKHEFWINSRKGLQLYDTRNNCITESLSNDWLKKKWFSIEHIDQENRIWSASETDGLRIYNPLLQQFEIVQFESQNERKVSYTRRVVEDTVHQKIFVCPQSSRGLFVLDQNTGIWECIPPPNDYDSEEAGGFLGWDMVMLEDGTLLIVEDTGLLYYKVGFKHMRRYPVQPPSANPRLRRIIKARDGYLWLAGYNSSIMRLDIQKQEIKTYREKINQKWKANIGGNHLAEDINGNIWMREHDGLLIYNKAKDDFIYHEYDPTDVRAFRGMGPIATDSTGDVWIATAREFLGYAHADSLESGILRLFGKEDGLLGDKVWLVKAYKEKLLVFTDKYLQVFNPKSMQFESSYALGYGLGQYNGNASLLSNGKLAVGKNKSYALFHPDSLKSNTELPIPYVSSFRYFDNTWDLANDQKHPDSIFLSYKQNFFSFEFSAITFTLPEKTKFRYQLEGFDTGWQDGTRNKFAAYTNVPGGDYRFLLEAINSEGLSSNEPSVTYLHISTVWWKTIWFWALAILLLTALAYLIHKWRIAQILKAERLKTEYENKLSDVAMSALRAQMNPHFIFNCLNSVEFYIMNNEQEKAVNYLGRFSRLIRLILENSNSTHVLLKDELEALKIYMEMESLRFKNLFDYEVKMEAGFNLQDIRVPPMLIQPYVENAIWHGLKQKQDKKGKIELTLRKSNNSLICLIEDNGIGREAARILKSKSAERRKSFGMKITGDRLNMLSKISHSDASVQVFDLKDEQDTATGTRVELVIPFITAEAET